MIGDTKRNRDLKEVFEGLLVEAGEEAGEEWAARLLATRDRGKVERLISLCEKQIPFNPVDDQELISIVDKAAWDTGAFVDLREDEPEQFLTNFSAFSRDFVRGFVKAATAVWNDAQDRT
jgi:hypothetical protein